jgi:hypothetical protein
MVKPHFGLAGGEPRSLCPAGAWRTDCKSVFCGRRGLTKEGGMTLSELVREAIRLGDASRAYWDRELPKRHPKYPLIRAGEDSGPPPPEDAQLQALLRSLPEEQVYALITLMYAGRGDFDVDHLRSAYQTMRQTFPTPEMAVDQMTGKGTLSEYLTDAVEEAQKRHLDLDGLRFAAAAPVR